MTRRSLGDEFKPSVFVQGRDAEYFEQMPARGPAGPGPVDETGQAFHKAVMERANA